MASLETTYAGLNLRSPIIVASAGITETVERMRKCQENGAGAVVIERSEAIEVAAYGRLIDDVVVEMRAEQLDDCLIGFCAFFGSLLCELPWWRLVEALLSPTPDQVSEPVGDWWC